MNNKIVVILGPTSSGKSDIAIKLAKKFNGEIISADSRQIYRGLNIGTGKIKGKWNKKHRAFISDKITHYGIDIVSPKTDYSVAKFQKYANKIIKDMLKRGKLPIICGGTGFWIKAVVDNIIYPEVKPNWVLRNKLRNKSKEELFDILSKLDSERAKTIDKNNPVRLIRAIEICRKIGKVPAAICQKDNKHQFLQIGTKLAKKKLHANIKKRLKKRFKAGMIEEVKNLHEIDKLSWKKIESFGLGYFWIPKYLHPVKSAKSGAATPLFNRVNGKILNKLELFNKIYQAEKDYAKRQKTWFRKDKRILWLPAGEAGNNIELWKKKLKNF